MTIQEIIERLPGSWSEMKLRDYQKIAHVKITESDDAFNMFVGVDNTIKVISALTGINVEELEKLSMADLVKAANRLEFMAAMPDKVKNGKIKWKQLEEIKYDDFVAYNMLQGDLFNNMPTIITCFSYKEKYKDGVDDMFVRFTKEEIEEMGMDEVHTGFFLLRSIMMKYADSSITSHVRNLVRILRKEKRLTRWQAAKILFMLRWNPQTTRRLLKSELARDGNS